MSKLRSLASLALASAATVIPGLASATPTTIYWAPSTTAVQGYLVPHITYDTYFGKGGIVSNSGVGPIYPVDTGLTMGILPFDKVNLEIGFDLLLPSDDPILFNAKLGVPEGLFFDGFPSLAVGIFGVGTNSDTTGYHILYGQVQKNLPWGGFVSAGAYYGAGKEALWTGSDGVARAGFMGGVVGPDINVNIPGLKKIVLIGDVQTGKNAFGAGGVGLTFYFTDAIDIITGPVFFFDSDIQPGKSSWLWTMQLDVDIALFSSPAPAAPANAQPAPSPTATASKLMMMAR